MDQDTQPTFDPQGGRQSILVPSRIFVYPSQILVWTSQILPRARVKIPVFDPRRRSF